MTRKKYTFDLLIEYMNKANARLINDTINYNNINKYTSIYFNCNCGKKSKKTFCNIIKGNGAYCTSCTKLIKQNNVFNIKLLNTIINRDNAINELLLIYPEDFIIVERKNIPKIEYIDNNNKKHYYFPDIYIPIDNLIIEVKSTWTYNCKKDNNNLKANTCKNMGYLFEFWIYDDKGNKNIKIIN